MEDQPNQDCPRPRLSMIQINRQVCLFASFGDEPLNITGQTNFRDQPTGFVLSPMEE